MLWRMHVLLILSLLPSTLLHAQFPEPDDFNPRADNNVNNFALQSDGKVLVAGNFTELAGQFRDRIGRLDSEGGLDDDFNPGVDSYVNSMVLQADRKILLGGNFTNLAGQARPFLGRLHPNGALDSSFNPSADGMVRCLAVQADGKVLAGGRFTMVGGERRDRIARLHPDGSPDPTFNPGANDEVLCLTVQTDGRILVGGSFTQLGAEPRNHLGRLHADGTLDDSFDPGAGSTVLSMVVQADDTILVGGGFLSLGGHPRSYLGRLFADGTLDHDYRPEPDWIVHSLMLQADGKLLVGGRFVSMGLQRRLRICRLHADGSLDHTFDPGGGLSVVSVVAQADGKVLVGGTFTNLAGISRDRIGRLYATGPASQSIYHESDRVTWMRGGGGPEVWRTTFEHSTNGVDWASLGAGSRIPGGWVLTGNSLPTNGTIRACGHAVGGFSNTSGWIVEGYSGAPVVLSQPMSRVHPADTTANFHLVVGGSGPWIVQWFKNGTLFLDQGDAVNAANTATLTLNQVLKADEGNYTVVASNPFGCLTSQVATLQVQDPFITLHPQGTNVWSGESADFHVTIAGTSPFQYQWFRNGELLPGAEDATLSLSLLSKTDAGHYTVRVSNSHGTATSVPALLTINTAIPDSTFKPVIDGSSPYVHSLAIQGDSKILVGGGFTVLGGEPRNYIGQIDAFGAATASFNPGANGWIYSMAVQDDGRFVLGGAFDNLGGLPRDCIGRLRVEGPVDSGFDPVATGDFASVSCLAIQADGKILVGGQFSLLGGQFRSHIGRIHENGALDRSFDPGANGPVLTIALQPNGQILMGGEFTSAGGQQRNHIARLDPDGKLDETFNPDASWHVHSLAVQADEKILVGGRFTALSGKPRHHIARLHRDGSLDESFDPGVLGNTVNSIALQANGAIVLGGYFSSAGGQPRNHIARLHGDGTIDHTFNPGTTSEVLSLAIQSDGNILVGGQFGVLGRLKVSSLGRLNNTELATQSLQRDPTGITWWRGGSSPEAWRTTFDHSIDGLTWTNLGSGTRIPGGWRLEDILLPPNGSLRARGHVLGGFRNASSWFVDSLVEPPHLLHLSIVRNGSNLLISWPQGQGPYQVQQTSDVSFPDSWQDAGAPLLTNSVSLPIESNTLFIRVREL